MIIQNKINCHLEIARRIMNHQWGREGYGWDRNSPAHKYWKQWAKRNFKVLKNSLWKDIYKRADYLKDKE